MKKNMLNEKKVTEKKKVNNVKKNPKKITKEISKNKSKNIINETEISKKEENKKGCILFEIPKWLYKGFLFECFIIYTIFKCLLYGIIAPFVYTYFLMKTASLKSDIRSEQKEKEFLEEIKKKAVENAKQEKKNDYIKSNNANNIEDIPSVERQLSLTEKIRKWYRNLPIVRKIELQKKTNEEAITMKFDSSDAEKSPFKIIYEYRAKAPNGEFVIDYFDAYSKIEVYSFLINEGYKVFSIRTSKYIQLLHGNLTGGTVKFKSKDLIFFLTQLSTYLKAGIPLIEALKILSRQYQKNRRYQKVFRKMIYDLTMGENFSTALDRQGNTFPRLLINMVKAAELTGELPDTLDKMAAYFTETHKTKQQMITALTYPAILFGLSLIVFVFIMLYVVPKFVSIYNAMDNVQLPGITRAILNLSNFLKSYLIWLILGITLVIVVIVYLYKNIKSFRKTLQQIFMRIPVFGNIIIFNEVTLFAQTLGTLLTHNVFITDSMEIMNKITNNEIYKSIIIESINNIAKGDKISTAFNHWAFPIPAYEMIVTGEKTGQLPEMMERVGSYYQELHRNEVSRIKTFMEPVLIIFLTVIVGVIVLAIVIPMFNMYSAIEGF